MPRQATPIVFRGGVDLESSPLAVYPGAIWLAENYEPVEGGYRRVRGYERFDGRPSPSGAEYHVLTVSLADGVDAAAVDDTVSGGGESGIVLAVVDATGRDAGRTRYVLGEVTGQIPIGPVSVGADPVGDAVRPSEFRGAETIGLHNDYLALAADRRRMEIGAVPGSGPVRGVWHYKGILYAVRDDEDGIEGRLWRASAQGWQRVPLGWRLDFDIGINEPLRGKTVTPDSATNRGTTLQRLAVRSGFWGQDGNAAGALYFRERPEAQDSDALRVDGEILGRAVGEPEEVTLPPGGRYDTRLHNFGAQADEEILIGVNGVGHGFLWDGVVTALAQTGHADDRPSHIAVQSQHVLFAFRGGSIVVSERGSATRFHPIRDAAEIGAGQDIIGMVESAGQGNTIIFGTGNIKVLYGRDITDFELFDLTEPDTGAVAWTMQTVGAPIYLDARGVRSIATTDSYGNFALATLSGRVQSWLNRQKERGDRPIASMVVRQSAQYRLFYESGFVLCLFFGLGDAEASILCFPHKVRCWAAFEAEENERLWFGSDDGWVFEAEKGRSFDGAEIRAFMRFPNTFFGYPALRKTIYGADLYCTLSESAAIQMSAIFDDGRSPDQLLDENLVEGGGFVWDGGLWNDFYWSSPLSGYQKYRMKGLGRDVSFLVRSVTAKEASHTINGITAHWSPRGLTR